MCYKNLLLKGFWIFLKHFIYNKKQGASKNESIVIKKVNKYDIPELDFGTLVLPLYCYYGDKK